MTAETSQNQGKISVHLNRGCEMKSTGSVGISTATDTSTEPERKKKKKKKSSLKKSFLACNKWQIRVAGNNRYRHRGKAK